MYYLLYYLEKNVSNFFFLDNDISFVKSVFYCQPSSNTICNFFSKVLLLINDVDVYV